MDHKYRKITLEKRNGEVVTFDFDDPGDEPVFLLRGQDKLAGEAVGLYSELALSAGLEELAEHATQHADAMDNWPIKKLPD